MHPTLIPEKERNGCVSVLLRGSLLSKSDYLVLCNYYSTGNTILKYGKYGRPAALAGVHD